MNYFLEQTIIFLFCATVSVYSDDSSDCTPFVNSAVGVFVTKIGNKCIYATSKSGVLTSACNSVGKGVKAQVASIDNPAENSQIFDALKALSQKQFYVGYANDGSKWYWQNGDPSVYQNLESVPSTTVLPTTARSTLPPSEQRRSTAIVIAIDASIYTTNVLTFAQVNFAATLAQYVADRGPSEFAVFAYGCTAISPSLLQYPNFVSSYDDAYAMILNLNETIIHDCVRANPLDFASMYSNQQSTYYNRYTYSPRPFKSQFMSMILFSSTTDRDGLRSTFSLVPISNSTVITVNVGTKAADTSRFSVPANMNNLKVNTVDDIANLVMKVDNIIFGSASEASALASSNSDTLLIKPRTFFSIQEKEIIDASTVTEGAYFDTSDGKGLWYSDGSYKGRNVLCQYFIPTPEPPPVPNPTISWNDPCHPDYNFHYFKDLENSKCYRTSIDKQTFSQVENECLSEKPVFLHSPQLTSVQSQTEMNKITTMLDVHQNEGMFWIGLRRNASRPDNWYFINGDVYDASTSYSNWRVGYPRDAEGCDCVAYVFNDGKWINTDCEKQLRAVCSYRYNSTAS